MHFAKEYIDLAPETQRLQRAFQPDGVTQEESGSGGGSPLLGRFEELERERERKRSVSTREKKEEARGLEDWRKRASLPAFQRMRSKPAA